MARGYRRGVNRHNRGRSLHPAVWRGQRSGPGYTSFRRNPRRTRSTRL